jgi:hypothetical protein
MRRVIAAVAVSVLMGGGVTIPLTLTAQAANADQPASPGCGGQTVALFNHNTPNPNGNPNASAGPGVSLGGHVSDAVHGAQSECL